VLQILHAKAAQPEPETGDPVGAGVSHG
jgi:hypothetical protein